MSFFLTSAHKLAASKKRCTVLHYDAHTVAIECGGLKAPEGMSLTEAYRLRLWDYIDTVLKNVTTIYWDAFMSDQIAFCRRTSFPMDDTPIYQSLWAEGTDLYDEFIAGCHERGIECYLSHRVSGPPIGGEEPLRVSHPEYYINDWTQMSDFASPGMRRQKLKAFREILENYDFDGYSLDFCRHTPFLEPGRQWELREHVTDFLRELREMTLAAEEKWAHPIMLSARVPESIEACHEDGLDVGTWAKESIVDSLTVGSRSFTVDLKGFRRETEGKVQLFPCFDAHHQSDAYADPSPEVLCGVYANWWADSADGITLFNLYACHQDIYEKTAAEAFRPFPHALFEEVLPLVGDPEALSARSKTYVTERKGGYPWENGGANNNKKKELPVILKNNGKAETVHLRALDPVAEKADTVDDCYLDILLYGVLPKDEVKLAFNGKPITGVRDDSSEDKELRPLQKEFVSGYHPIYLPPREERFTRIRCPLTPADVIQGSNEITASVLRAPNYPNLATVELEKCELHVIYR